MMKNTIISMLAALALLASCHKDDKNDEPEQIERTVLVYLAGDNNLAGMGGSYDYLPADVREMMQGSKQVGTNNKLVLFVDHYGQRPYYLLVEDGDTTRLKTLDQEVKSSSPNTLYDAMTYATTQFPAKSYGLVLWGHSDGWIIHEGTTAGARSAAGPRKAYGVDHTGGKKWMEIKDMATTLKDFPKLSFIFADCCCFMCAENCYELRDCADYIIGSPAEIPAVGAPYQTVVPQMFSQDAKFYEEIVNAYYAQKSSGYDLPLAAVKTSELDDLARATATTLASFADKIEADADGCRYPDVEGLIFYYDHTQFDMQDFIKHYASEDQYQAWKAVFDRAVPASTFSTVWTANHILYKDRDFRQFFEFSPTEGNMGSLGMFVPQRTRDAAKWSMSYLNNLGVTMTEMNRDVKKMQWYTAARLADFGW